MTDVDVKVVQVRLRRGDAIEEIAADLGVSMSTLLRHFRAATGMSPRAWRHEEIGSQAEPSPVVAFRLAEHKQLEDLAADAGQEPSEYAKEVLRRHLRRYSKK